MSQLDFRFDTSDSGQLEGSPGEVLGIDDMNIVEIILGLPGSRKPPSGEVLSVPWKRGERSYYMEYSSSHLEINWEARGRSENGERDFFILVETAESRGLPGPLAEDVFVALLKITADNGFSSPEITTTRHSLLQLMQWHTGGDYYDRLEKILHQFVNMSVSTNALWDPQKQRYKRGAFNILDSWDTDDEKSNDLAAPITVRWGSKMFDVFDNNYMKQLDTRLYYSLNNATTKRTYRWLDKHLSMYPVVEIDVLRFAHKVLGYGVSYRYPSKVIGKLTPRLDKLSEIGFCHWEVEPSSSDSGKKFVFSRLTDFSSVTLPRREDITEALASRGVNNAGHLVDTFGWDRCLRQMAYLDWRQNSGKDVKDPGAWLAQAIREGHTLPNALKSQLDRASQNTAAWCDAMYESLTVEEQATIEGQIDDLMQHEKVAESQVESRRRKLRNRLLLARRKQF
jgi:hypothetical protein